MFPARLSSIPSRSYTSTDEQSSSATILPFEFIPPTQPSVPPSPYHSQLSSPSESSDDPFRYAFQDTIRSLPETEHAHTYGNVTAPEHFGQGKFTALIHAFKRETLKEPPEYESLVEDYPEYGEAGLKDMAEQYSAQREAAFQNPSLINNRLSISASLHNERTWKHSETENLNLYGQVAYFLRTPNGNVLNTYIDDHTSANWLPDELPDRDNTDALKPEKLLEFTEINSARFPDRNYYNEVLLGGEHYNPENPNDFSQKNPHTITVTGLLATPTAIREFPEGYIKWLEHNKNTHLPLIDQTPIDHLQLLLNRYKEIDPNDPYLNDRIDEALYSVSMDLKNNAIPESSSAYSE